MRARTGVDSMNMGSLRAELAFPASYKSGADTVRRGSCDTGVGGASDDDGEELDDDDLMMMVMGSTPQQGARTWRLQPPGSRFDNGQPALRAQQVRRALQPCGTAGACSVLWPLRRGCCAPPPLEGEGTPP